MHNEEIGEALADIVEHADAALLCLSNVSGMVYWTAGAVPACVGMAQSYLIKEFPMPPAGGHKVDVMMNALEARVMEEYDSMEMFVTRTDDAATFFFYRGYGNMFARGATVRYFLADTNSTPRKEES